MRILGITIPEKKRLEYSLTVLYGIGLSRSRKILDATGIDRARGAETLSVDEENKVRIVVEDLTLEGNLKREISANVKRLKDIKAYRGIRHMKKLPTRGQRTKTNSRTIRGNVRKTMGSGRRKLEKT